MYIISKKKILFIIFNIIIGISIFTFSNIYINNSNLKLSFRKKSFLRSNLNSTISTSSIPVSNHTIVLDAGHGFPDGGAINENGVFESNINLQIVKKLQELLEASNCNVILTRSDENGIHDLNSKNKKSSDLKNRIELINNSNAEILVSIHLNKIPQSQYSGWQSFYQKGNENSKKLAKLIQDNLNYSIQKTNKREILPISNIYIMDNSKLPSVIIECGFLSNENEANLLQKDDYQNNLAWGIYTGIMDYFK